MGTISGMFDSIRRWLLPVLEEEAGELTEKQKEFVGVVAAMELEKYLPEFRWCGVGRRKKDRLSLLKAFVAKSVFGYQNTKMMIEAVKGNPAARRLCGWERECDVPSEPTFSRAFAEFAESGLPQKIHEGMVKKYLGGKLVGRISRDSTAIDAVLQSAGEPDGSAEGMRLRGEVRQLWEQDDMARIIVIIHKNVPLNFYGECLISFFRCALRMDKALLMVISLSFIRIESGVDLCLCIFLKVDGSIERRCAGEVSITNQQNSFSASSSPVILLKTEEKASLIGKAHKSNIFFEAGRFRWRI